MCYGILRYWFWMNSIVSLLLGFLFNADYALGFVTACLDQVGKEIKCKKISHFGKWGVANPKVNSKSEA